MATKAELQAANADLERRNARLARRPSRGSVFIFIIISILTMMIAYTAMHVGLRLQSDCFTWNFLGRDQTICFTTEDSGWRVSHISDIEDDLSPVPEDAPAEVQEDEVSETYNPVPPAFEEPAPQEFEAPVTHPVDGVEMEHAATTEDYPPLPRARPSNAPQPERVEVIQINSRPVRWVDPCACV